MSDSDVTLGFPTHVEQPGRLREGASRVPVSAPMRPSTPGGRAGPAQAPAGGYRAGSAGKRPPEAVGAAGPSCSGGRSLKFATNVKR